MLKLRDNIQNLMRVDGEPIHETWLRFQKLLLQCPTHGLWDNVLLQYFYPSLDIVNKGIDNQLIWGRIMRQPFVLVSTFLDEMTKINRAWHTREDHVSPLNVELTKEQMEKNQEHDENMAKMITQMDLLTKHVMGGGYKAVNAISASSGMIPNDAHFDAMAMYNEEVQFLLNQAWVSHPSYPRPGGNQGWNKDRDGG